jgi:light-regulated signal transduction histidine kinase (bacteriophytochrome)
MILEDDPNLSIDSKEKLNIIRNRVQRMDDLLHALLEYSRADRGVKKLALTDVNEIIRPIVERRKNDKPVNVLTHNLPVINTNSSKLEQVFDILITNSYLIL